MDALRKLRSQLGHGMVRAWDTLAEGWREILARSSDALTHYTTDHGREEPGAANRPEWALLPAETWETAQTVIVRVEIPGMQKEDLQVAITGNALRIRGEKHSGAEEAQGRLYHVMERAFGRFERTIPLCHGVDPKQAEVSYSSGVLTVILQKTAPVPPHELRVQ